MSKRWTYQIVEIKLSTFGSVKKDDIQSELNRLGAQGWELVAVTHPSAISPVLLSLKKEN